MNVPRLSPAQLMVRRPLSVPADGKAGPGGYDFTSHPLPDAQMDCQEPRALAGDLDLKRLRSCLYSIQSLKKKTEFHFRLARVAQPQFELLDPEDAPECIRQLLGRISVPREIFFQGLPLNDHGGDTGPYYDCYAASIDLQADEMMGVKVAKARWDLRVKLPLRIFPKNDDETLRLYLGWAISPFFSKEKDEPVVPSRFVPEAICKSCLTEKRMLKTGDPLPLLWP